MGFYNIRAVTPVGNPVLAGSGKTSPLDVVEYGGLAYATVTPANNTIGTILAAPPAGSAYRLHRWGLAPVASSGFAILNDSLGTLDSEIVQVVGGSGLFNQALFGLLATGAVTVTNEIGATGTFWLRYDTVTIPFIS